MIQEILETGAANARTARDLCILLNLDRREFFQIVENERNAGAPICASRGVNPGYYLAKNSGEMEAYCKTMANTIKSLQKTHRACVKAGKKLEEIQ